MAIQHRRSGEPGNVPQSNELIFGQIGINYADGKLFIKKLDGSIICIGADISQFALVGAVGQIPNATISAALAALTAHIQATDPHPQYATDGDLAAALASKAAAVHSHQTADIADLAAQLASKAAAVDTHPASDITGLSTGGTVTGNIKFPITQGPSLDPNTLDDYEEGTFSPALMVGGFSTGIAHAVKVGRYIKIGRLVNIQLTIAITSKGTGTGGVTISGLPFPAITSLAEAAVCIGQSNLGAITGYIPSNTSKITLVNTSGTAITHINLSDSSSIKISATYETAA